MKLLLIALTLASAVTPMALAQRGAGAPYESRDPFVCASKTEPATGAPSGSRLRDLVQCTGEKIYDRDLYLFENLKVEIGKGRRYQASDSLAQNIDPSQLVYPIRGSYDRYQCSIINPKFNMKGYNHGDNCSIYPQPNAEGICYRTTFGEWHCSMSDIGAGVSLAKHYQPPPK